MATAKTWSICNKSSSKTIVEFDSIVNFSVDLQTSVASELVEGGSFSSYNKNIQPITIDATLAIQGTADVRQTAMSKLVKLRSSTSLFSFVTPEYVFYNMNLEGLSEPQRTNTAGANILLITLHMKEVRAGGSSSKVNKEAQDDSVTKSGSRQTSSS